MYRIVVEILFVSFKKTKKNEEESVMNVNNENTRTLKKNSILEFAGSK